MSSINPADVEIGIGFRITESLSFAQHGVILQSPLPDFGEDEVTRPVENARKAIYPVSGKAFP